MQDTSCRLLSIVPYRLLPITNGGQLSIAEMHHFIGLLCDNHVAGTVDNDDNLKFSFTLHKIFPTGVKRYIPYTTLSQLKQLVKEQNIKALYCDHPYMAMTTIALARSMKLPWYLRSHNIESERFRNLGKKWWPVLHWYERFAMKQAKGIFFVADEDRKWAIEHYKLQPGKCHFIPFSVPFKSSPTGHAEAKQRLSAQLNISAGKPWLYFLGALNYFPNTHAVEFICSQLIPELDRRGVDYHILLAGKGLPEATQQAVANTGNITYLGFVPDITDVLLAGDVMLNPVVLGGGVKTKAVEALAYNKMVVSAESGAAGLMRDACGNNLLIAPDNDVKAFADKVIQAISAPQNIPAAFYEIYYNGNTAQKVVNIMQENITEHRR
jgi:polysaccharide biosynthesis protein PslH